jgi:hypothetical protein
MAGEESESLHLLLRKRERELFLRFTIYKYYNMSGSCFFDILVFVHAFMLSTVCANISFT